MLLKELVEKIDTKGTPIYFFECPIENCDYCYSRTTTSEELAMLRGSRSENARDEELGVHLLNVEPIEIFNRHSEINPASVIVICSILNENFTIPEDKMIGAYALFIVLHEIGHWQHLVESELSRTDYWIKYERQRDPLWIKFQTAYQIYGNTPEAQLKCCLYFNYLYRQLPSEKAADDYAIKELPHYLELI